MLYVFLVDTGTMMTFDMNLAMESVCKLQTVISKACHISEDKQVLLISGGESLDPHARVGRYSAGTDTNPIYLFSKTTIEAATPPSPSIHYGSDVDLKGQVEGSLLMPPAYETVVSRTQLAVQFHEVDEDELKACVNLVHDQHLQQQGWAAVVANLEDITVALKQRSEIFQSAYKEYLDKRDSYLQTLSHIGESLHLQTKIPLLSCLPTQSSSDVVVLPTNKLDNPDDATYSTLFQWINSQDPHHSLQDMVDRCIKAAEQFDDTIAESLSKEVTVATEAVGNLSMKEVKGLEDRLYGLDQIMSGARKLVEEQSDMSKGFLQNQSRATNLRDKSILPDLCASHKKQLVAMLNNHKKLRDIKKKCRMAKEELAVNLHTRLRWVMFVEKKICDVDGKLTIYHESLRRLHKQLDIMKQIEDAPKVYAQLVVEVVRRRMFSLQFMEWANSLAEETKQIHSEEVKRRQSFQLEIGKHFLQSLFHGFEDLPPPYATEAPGVFDKYLPEITSQDVEMLRQTVPELDHIFRVPNDIPVSQRMSFQTVGTSVSCHDKPGQTSTANSEIDILHNSGLFVHIDSSKISLGEQVATCLPSDIIINPETVSIVEKPDFLVPQSLSETLTLEMSSQVKGISVESVVGKESLVVSSSKKQTDVSDMITSSNSGDAETQRSTESDPQSSEKSVRKSSSRKKSLGRGTDTSPEMETSHEFTTADFYFDESMPSSMIDSPPNKSAVLEKVALTSSSDKAEIIVSLEKAIESRQQIVQNLKNKMALLCKLVTSELKPLKEHSVGLKDSIVKDQRIMQSECVSTQSQIVQTLEKYVNNINLSQAEHIQNLTQNHSIEIANLETLLAAEKDVVSNIQEQLDNVKKELDADKVLHETIQTQLRDDIKSLKEDHKTKMEETKQQHQLELELELDKLREELNSDLTKHETVIQTLKDQLQASEEKLDECLRERETAIEALNHKFQVEKEEINQILADNYEKKQAEEIENIKLELTKEHKDFITKSKEELQSKFEENAESFKKSLQEEKESEISKVTTSLVKENENKMSELSAKFNEDKTSALESLQESLENKHVKKLAELQTKFEEDKSSSVESLKASLENEHVAKLAELQTKFDVDRSSSLENLKASLEKENAAKIVELQTKFNEEKQKLLATMKNEDKITIDKEQQTDEEVDEGQSDKIILLKEKLEAEYKSKLEKVLQEERDKQLLEISNLEMQFNKEREDSLNNFKTSIVAEKQIQFNEAVEKVSREKDKVIDSLKVTEENLKQELESQKLSFDKIAEENAKSDEEAWREKLQQKEKEFGLIKHKLEDDLALSRQQIAQYQLQLMGVSTLSVTPSEEGATCAESVYKLPAADIEKTLRSKDVEISNLKEKIMEMSMTASTKSIAQDKVSITSCKVGDLVLLCLDEPHDQYIVFTVRTTLHFLHSDCLEILGLKTAPGESRKSWILAEITDKEYCQAKKPQNRFKVPIGTKFYRVKAIPWSRDPSSGSGQGSSLGK